MKGVIKSRRGSHIDVVISFVIFIIFLGFLYSIISPIKVQENKEAVLNYLEKEIKDKLSADLISSSTKIPGVYTWDCFQVEHAINFEGLNVIVKDENEIPVRFGLINTPDKKYLRIDGTPDNEGYPGKRSFKIYYSTEEFKTLPLAAPGEEGCTFEPNTYHLETEDNPIKQVGLVRTEKYIFETKVKETFEDEESYKELKDNLDLPYGSEFSFNFTFNDRTSAGFENKKILTNTYAKEIPVQYVDEEANIILGYLNIKVW